MFNLQNTLSPFDEMLSYETLWGLKRGSLKEVAALFERNAQLPSKLLATLQAETLVDEVLKDVQRLVRDVREKLAAMHGFSVCIHRDFQYPERLRAARYPLELFYYRGDIGLAASRCVSVVGARKCSPEGLKRAAKLARGLVEAGFTVVSGLAEGVDTAAMKAAMETEGGRTIGVIGTPINENYPKSNKQLQECVAQEHLLVSQVPFYHYAHEPFTHKKRYFPERNETMSALSEATIIVEASDTSGSLTQARACLQQGRKLFILNSCFENREISWPSTYEKRGAIRIRELDDVLKALGGGGANAGTDAVEKI
jgi:DNA processing protein